MSFQKFWIAALTVAMLLPMTVSAEVSLTKSFVISKPIGGREFMNPQSVAVDPKRGDVYVADTGNSRIAILTKDGYSSGYFSHRTDGDSEGSSEPLGVAVDSRGSIYVTDSSSNCIYIYDFRGRLTGRLTVPFPGDEKPVFGRMMVDPADNLYVVARNKGVICILDSKGRLKQTVGAKGKGDGKFEMLADVAVDLAGRIYALDSLGTPVQVFDPEGKFLFGFGIHATGRGNFAHPTAIDVDPNGRVWVIDSFAQAVNIYDSKGKFLTDSGGFFFPIDTVFVPSLSRLYVLEKNGRRLLGFDVK